MASYSMEDGPSVNSSDREERIEARRARIQARIDAMNAEGEDPKALARKKADRERKEFVKGKQQILESNHRLTRLKTAGIEHVTSVRVNADNRENRRRIAEEERRQERRHKLLTEAENSAKRNAAIAMKWNAVIAKEIPQELLAEMTAQRESCKRVIDSKEKLRKEFLVRRAQKERKSEARQITASAALEDWADSSAFGTPCPLSGVPMCCHCHRLSSSSRTTNT